jgi:hypothetical protein
VSGSPNKEIYFSIVPLELTRSGQLSDLLDINGEILTDEQRSLVERLIAGKTSLSQLLKNCIVPRAKRQSWVDQLLLRGILLTDRFWLLS